MIGRAVASLIVPKTGNNVTALLLLSVWFNVDHLIPTAFMQIH